MTSLELIIRTKVKILPRHSYDAELARRFKPLLDGRFKPVAAGWLKPLEKSRRGYDEIAEKPA
jgi:hypothetical protein